MNFKARDIDGSWAILQLKDTIEAFNAEASAHTKQMLRLTRAITVLTVALFVLGFLQVALMVWHP